MKKLILSGAFLLCSITGFSQNIFPASGNVGIGTTSPNNKLEVITTSSPLGGSITNLCFLGYRSSNSYTGIYMQHVGYGVFENGVINTYRGTKLLSVSGNVNKSFLEFESPKTTNTSIAAINFGYNNRELFRINRDGKVRIADASIDLATPSGYRLFVQDGILTEKVKVAVSSTSNWADYVFASDYKLMSLKDVEDFIKENKHLPNVPSAIDMVNNGLDVAQTDAKLLEKIEELTLYTINQENEINSLKEKVNKQETELNKLKSLVNQLLSKENK